MGQVLLDAVAKCQLERPRCWTESEYLDDAMGRVGFFCRIFKLKTSVCSEYISHVCDILSQMPLHTHTHARVLLTSTSHKRNGVF